MRMTNAEFGLRLAQIRTKKEISARALSIAIRQTHSYIHNIESGSSFPTMPIFLKICDQLKITPAEFFNTNLPDPYMIQKICHACQYLNSDQLSAFLRITEELASSNLRNESN